MEAWEASDHQLNYILTALNFSNLYDLSKVPPPCCPPHPSHCSGPVQTFDNEFFPLVDAGQRARRTARGGRAFQRWFTGLKYRNLNCEIVKWSIAGVYEYDRRHYEECEALSGGYTSTLQGINIDIML